MTLWRSALEARPGRLDASRAGLLGSLAGKTCRAGVVLLDAILPPRCVACGTIVDRQGHLCPDCFRQTGFITEPFCAACGVPFPSAAVGGLDRLCPGCRVNRPVFGRARAALRYDAQGRRLILPFKHADRTEISTTLAPYMARAGAALLAECDLLVPVPLHRSRLFRRHYNQAALLARAVGRIAGRVCLPDALQRLRATASLGERSAAERAAEVANAFAVRPARAARLVGRRVVLVDDVMTSGATANACATALREAGATAVDVLVAARVPDPRLG